MKKRTRNILIGTGVTVAGIGAVTAISYHLTKKLLNLAMDREEPAIMTKNKNKVTGSKEMNEMMEALDTAAEKLENSGCEEVEIVADDGVRLVGHWHTCENPKRIIVAMHGWRSTWSHDFGVISDFWHNSDCCVLYAEQRGQGNSGGDYMGFGLLERYDCLDWINWVNERTGGTLPIYLGGVSMGATTILMTAGLELPDNVKGIVADCGFTCPQAVWKHVVEKNRNIAYDGIRSAIASDMCKKRINVGANDYSSVEAMKVCKVPVLFIHGTDDHFVPIEMTYENYKACVSEKRLFIVPGAEHGMSYAVDKDGYEKATKQFWTDFD